MKEFVGKKTKSGIEFFDFDNLNHIPNNLKTNHFRLKSAATVSTNLKTL